MHARDIYLNYVREYLKRVSSKRDTSETQKIEETLNKIKEKFVLEGNQEKAKEIWVLRQILKVQRTYLNSFSELKQGNFYQGWCQLEVCENLLLALEKHFHFEKVDDYRLIFIRDKVEKFQSLFPYKIFVSPEFELIELLCSVCEKKISPRNHCSHVAGEIYNGEICNRIVKSANILALSATENPRNKYAVMFLTDSKTGEQIDQFDYSLLKYLMGILITPFNEWSYLKTKVRHPHSKFKNVGRNDQCPCESGKKYKKCCLNEIGVLKDHVEFQIHHDVPNNIPKISYNY